MEQKPIQALRLEEKIPGVFTTTVHDGSPVSGTAAFVIPALVRQREKGGFVALLRWRTVGNEGNLKAREFSDRALSWFNVLLTQYEQGTFDPLMDKELIDYFDQARQWTVDMLAHSPYTEPLSLREVDAIEDAWCRIVGSCRLMSEPPVVMSPDVN